MNGTRQLDARTLLIEETQMLPTLPDRPEPTEAEREAARQADKYHQSKLLQDFAWTPTDLDEAAGYGFPRPTARAVKGWGRSGDGEPIYSRKLVAAWRQRFEEFAAKLK